MSFDIAAYIDHTALKPGTSMADIDKLCLEAATQRFAAVCVPLKFVSNAKKMLDGSGVKIATVIAFPSGKGTPAEKKAEIERALSMGADEVDMVIDLCALKNGDMQQLEDEITICLWPVKAMGKRIKLIVESGILTDKELIACCKLYSKYDIDYMKTSTGFAETGATVEAVQIMRANLPDHIGIKASGGIRTYEFAKELIDAGATRIGTSAGMEIVKESELRRTESVS